MLTIIASANGEILCADSMRDHQKAIETFEGIIDCYAAATIEDDKANNVVSAITPEVIEKAKKDRVFVCEDFKVELVES